LNDLECGPKIEKTDYVKFTSNPLIKFETQFSLDAKILPDFWFNTQKDINYLGYDSNGVIYCSEIEGHDSFGSIYDDQEICTQICAQQEMEMLINNECNSCGC